ncbi:MAG: GNAT family N-acetyltransferase [Acidobacteria bacterium]|nr:GNAT family N-acetyltransferase [Acidobacteriota bacterium]
MPQALRKRQVAQSGVIQTERLTLRHWRRGDAASLNRACNTPQVMRWLGGVQSRAEVREDVSYFQACQKEDGHTFWVMERRSDQEFLGFCGFVLTPDQDCPVRGELEIGWRVRADEWRNGYAEEAARACVAWSAKHRPAARVVSRTAQSNWPSRRLMEKLGMRRQTSLDYDPDDGSERLLVYTISRDQATLLQRVA